MGKLRIGLMRILPLWNLLLILAAVSAYGNETIDYSGPFTNTTYNSQGNVVIRLNIGMDNTLSGYTNFSGIPGGPLLCGAGDITGSKQGNAIEFSFKSRDPDPGCGFDWGFHFTLTGTLSEDGRVFEGNYYAGGQQGFFRVTSTATPTITDPSGIIVQSVYPTEIPQGQAPNLIVLVHGCCTDEKDLTGWNRVRSSIQAAILKNSPLEAWEIVVWDWTDFTKSINPYSVYYGAPFSGYYLGREIVKWPYHYIHFIAHSAGSRLIHEAAKYIKIKDDTPPFIHSTFLDAFCPSYDGIIYAKYSDYAEQYVDRGLLYTRDDLWGAYNFDVTYLPTKEPIPTQFSKGWPNEWYAHSALRADS